MSHPSILLLDDDVEVLEALQRFLRKRGYDVTATAWPTDAADLLGDTGRHFDVMITDIQMPAISGFTLMRALRESHPEVPVIVVSAFANTAICEAALEYGAVACLEKPVDTDLLLEVISRASQNARQVTPGA